MTTTEKFERLLDMIAANANQIIYDCRKFKNGKLDSKTFGSRCQTAGGRIQNLAKEL